MDERHLFGLERKGCRMCERLFKEYSLRDGQAPDELLTEYFPEVAKENGIE